MKSTAFSFKVEVKTYCPYPIHCESGIFFVAICQKVMLLSKSIFFVIFGEENVKVW